MPSGSVLTPREAACIATNSYFTLKDWINNEPRAGVESRANIKDRVLGSGSSGTGGLPNTSLKGSGLGGAQLGNVHSAQTGFGTTSGFGYTLKYQAGGQKHVVFATRGTRPEMSGVPDLITDLRASMTMFGDFGPVHKGFKKTFDSLLPNLERDKTLVADADYVHCVGHSLGGGVATLVASHFAKAGKAVRLYTFGCPRVGAMDTYALMERRIGKGNIYRVAHDLDPISLIAPYPYIHVLPSPRDPNNMTLRSPTGRLLSTANHDMGEYIKSVGDMEWSGVRQLAGAVDHDNALVARWLLHEDNDPGWVQYASAKTLSLLFKLFEYVLKNISTCFLLSLSAVDFLAEILLKGLNRMKELGGQIAQLLRYAATWAGIQIAETADFTGQIIRAILDKMVSSLKELAAKALGFVTRNITAVTVGIGGAWALNSFGVI